MRRRAEKEETILQDHQELGATTKERHDAAIGRRGRGRIRGSTKTKTTTAVGAKNWNCLHDDNDVVLFIVSVIPVSVLTFLHLLLSPRPDVHLSPSSFPSLP
jgi:hypothetical protein